MKASRVKIDWNPSICVFASEQFLKTLSNDYGWLGGIDECGRLRCILPYSVIHKSVFRMIRFPVQTIVLNDGIGIEDEKLFLNSAVEYFRSAGADVVIPATFNTVFRTYPDGAIVAPFGSYVLDLTPSEEELWNNLHSKHRNVIRNAIKKGVRILVGPEYLETAYGLVKKSFERSANGLAGRLRVEIRMRHQAFKDQILGLGEYVKVFVAEYNGVVQGCAVVPFSGHSAFYMHGGSISNPLTGAMNLLQWEAIRQFRGLGVRQYDFFGARVAPDSGSKVEGIMKFKERFGGRLIQGYMWKFPLRSTKYRFYSIAAKLRNGGDIVDQERHKLNLGI